MRTYHKSKRKAKTPQQRAAAEWSTSKLLEVLAKPAIQRLLASAGGDARLVGRWVWITFPERPYFRIRTFLRATGFKWNQKRGAWQHSCGVHSVRSDGNPRWKYGEVRLLDTQDEDKAVA